MLHTSPLIRFRATAGISLVIGVAMLAGCAQQPHPTSYYDTPHDSTLADAQHQAQGGRGARAPSQLQFGFGESEEARAARHAQAPVSASTNAGADGVATYPAADTTQTPRPLLEAKTFLGTVPCVTSDANCPASRITLTLAPSGEWRARTVRVDAPNAAQAMVQQGCWDVMGTDPLRIVMQSQNQESKTGLTFVNDNVLRINMYNDIRPVLDYHLTRQADIDPIDELNDQPALSCN